MYKILAPYATYSKRKQHIQGNKEEMRSLCGKYLGFDFGIKTISGFENDIPKQHTIDDLIKTKDICIKCLKSIIKTS